MTNLQERLFCLADETYRDFNAKQIPNVDKSRIIGVRTPVLKALAKELMKSEEYKIFLNSLPHRYFEENQLHAFIIGKISDFDTAVFELERFLKHVDNWATCDGLVLKAVAKEPERVLHLIDRWIKSDEVYTVRFAIGLLMRYFLDNRFNTKYSDTVAEIKSDEYYVKMMSAWYFATALAKQYNEILPYFKDERLSKWVHNKAIQKARESFRVSDAHKCELRTMIRK